LFAALEYYRPRVRRTVSADFWPVVREWSHRVDNWAHADTLSGMYSSVLAYHHDAVYPQLERWSTDEGQWLRRMSIVSLIHYSGKNAVFMPLDEVLALVSNCLPDHRYYMTRASAGCCGRRVASTRSRCGHTSRCMPRSWQPLLSRAPSSSGRLKSVLSYVASATPRSERSTNRGRLTQRPLRSVAVRSVAG
jgi:3-methyladenine DNA glycosylase AlkD